MHRVFYYYYFFLPFNSKQIFERQYMSNVSNICISLNHLIQIIMEKHFFILLCLDFAACIRNCYNWEGRCYLQISVRSHCSFGVLVRCVPCSVYCIWLFIFVLPIQRKVGSTGSFIPKHWLHCLLQYCLVSKPYYILCLVILSICFLRVFYFCFLL